ncbi:DUF1289 domain-containing protein [Ideonella livida]|uniref:DUF1289 domain-containing protein n=1 Tax=Ideonella livida TaxID=2707176 RepID=A0A7C9TP09_9BURK|nr:DUF1289 domain-containing protein [Ideonella livida]NDY93106.1 DUF1289 domain-containing protein [Ideonella livida]
MRSRTTGRAGVASPCTGVCRMAAADDPATGALAGLCAGCHRSLDEIAGWSRLDEAAQRAVWVQVGLRRRQAGLPPRADAPR